jgi:predicted membrane GTPase involved in stress response
VNDEHAGAVIEALGLRRGELLEMGPAAGAGAGPEGSNSGGRQRLAFVVPSRGMIQFRWAATCGAPALGQQTGRSQ